MAYDFPTSPTTGQTYTNGVRTWQYNGAAWDLMTQTGQNFTFAASPPSTPFPGDRWMDSGSGVEYTYVNDGNTSQWMEATGTIQGTGGAAGSDGVGGRLHLHMFNGGL